MPVTPDLINSFGVHSTSLFWGAQEWEEDLTHNRHLHVFNAHVLCARGPTGLSQGGSSQTRLSGPVRSTDTSCALMGSDAAEGPMRSPKGVCVREGRVPFRQLAGQIVAFRYRAGSQTAH